MKERKERLALSLNGRLLEDKLPPLTKRERRCRSAASRLAASARTNLVAAARPPSPYVPPSPLAASEQARDASQPNAVFLNVYDIVGTKSFLGSIGLGVHHVGVQVFNKEYQYGYRDFGQGVGRVEPRQSMPNNFREQIYVGKTNFSAAAVEEVALTMRDQDIWLGSKYHVVRHNCIDFARALCEALMPPEVRVAQVQEEDLSGVQKTSMEEVEVDGKTYSVPVLIPYHVDRLSRHVARLLPQMTLRRLDATALPHISVSGGSQPPQMTPEDSVRQRSQKDPREASRSKGRKKAEL